jgi:hypothetical protein
VCITWQWQNVSCALHPASLTALQQHDSVTHDIIRMIAASSGPFVVCLNDRYMRAALCSQNLAYLLPVVRQLTAQFPDGYTPVHAAIPGVLFLQSCWLSGPEFPAHLLVWLIPAHLPCPRLQPTLHLHCMASHSAKCSCVACSTWYMQVHGLFGCNYGQP